MRQQPYMLYYIRTSPIAMARSIAPALPASPVQRQKSFDNKESGPKFRNTFVTKDKTNLFDKATAKLSQKFIGPDRPKPTGGDVLKSPIKLKPANGFSSKNGTQLPKNGSQLQKNGTQLSKNGTQLSKNGSHKLETQQKKPIRFVFILIVI